MLHELNPLKMMKLKTTLLSALFLTILFSCNTNNEANEKLIEQVYILQIENDSLTDILTKDKMNSDISETPQWYYPETDSRQLLESGIEEPEAYIKNALLEKTDLIPMDAVLGGTMHYNNIQLLGNKWLIADFEDGHVYGKAIFEYELRDQDEVHFKIIALSQN